MAGVNLIKIGNVTMPFCLFNDYGEPYHK